MTRNDEAHLLSSPVNAARLRAAIESAHRGEGTPVEMDELRAQVEDGDAWNWFDHPEMQARIAEAEADRREGRVYITRSAAEFQALMDSWKLRRRRHPSRYIAKGGIRK